MSFYLQKVDVKDLPRDFLFEQDSSAGGSSGGSSDSDKENKPEKKQKEKKVKYRLKKSAQEPLRSAHQL